MPYSESLEFLSAAQQDRLHICADVCLPVFLFVLFTLPSLEDKHPRRWLALAYSNPIFPASLAEGKSLTRAFVQHFPKDQQEVSELTKLVTLNAKTCTFPALPAFVRL